MTIVKRSNDQCHVYELSFKYTTKFSLPKIACPAIVYVEIVVVIDLFFVGVCPWIKVDRYNPTEICQQRLQGVRKVAQKLCSWERSFNYTYDYILTEHIRKPSVSKDLRLEKNTILVKHLTKLAALNNKNQ